MSFLTSTFVTAFEAVCLIRCARPAAASETRRPRFTGAPAHPVPSLAPAPAPASRTAAIAEFDREDAAERLTTLLGGLGYQALARERDGGGVRRYAVQQVLIAEPDRAAVNRVMATSWQRGRQRLLGTDPLGSSSPHHAHRVVLARAVWNAGLLVGRLRPRLDHMRVGLAEPDMVAVLVRAARLVGVTAVVSRRSGCFVVSVPQSAAATLVNPCTVPAVAAPVLVAA